MIAKFKHFIILLLSFFYYSTVLYSQNFNYGYSLGFKEGYCHDNGISCIPPIPPIPPIPNVGEDYNSYMDGYNRGFKDGLFSKTNYSSNNNNNSYWKVVPPTKWIPPISEDLLVQGAIYRSQQISKMYNIVENYNNHINSIHNDYKKRFTNTDVTWKKYCDFISSINSSNIFDNYNYIIKYMKDIESFYIEEINKSIFFDNCELLYNQKKYLDVILEYNKYISKNPSSGIAYYNRGLANHMQGYEAYSKIDFQRAYDLGVIGEHNKNMKESFIVTNVNPTGKLEFPTTITNYYKNNKSLILYIVLKDNILKDSYRLFIKRRGRDKVIDLKSQKTYNSSIINTYKIPNKGIYIFSITDKYDNILFTKKITVN